MYGNIRIIHHLDNLDGPVELLFTCSNVLSSLVRLIVIRDTVSSSVAPTVRLFRLYDFPRKQSGDPGEYPDIIFYKQTDPSLFHSPCSSFSSIISLSGFPGGTIGRTFASRSMINSMTVGTVRVFLLPSEQRRYPPLLSHGFLRAVAFRQFHKIGRVLGTFPAGICACRNTTPSAAHAGGRITPVKEHFLPLPYIAQVTVIQDTDDDGKFVDHGCCHLLDIHLHASVAGYDDHVLVWIAEFRTECRRESISHCAESSGGHQLPVLVEREVLCRPQLILPDVGRDDGVIKRLVDRADDHCRREPVCL